MFVYGLGLIGAINQYRCVCNLLFLRQRKVGEWKKSLTIMGGALVTREVIQRKNAMQFYEIASLLLMCRYFRRYCNSQQRRHYRRVSTGGSLKGWRLFWFWRLTVKPHWDYLITSKIAPVSSCNCQSSKTVWTAQPDVTHQSSILSMKTVLDSPILASATR